MDCLQGLKMLEENSIDLTVTSPPYDDLRTYNGYSFDFENIAKECVNKKGIQVVGIIDCASPYVIEDIENFLQNGEARDKNKG